MSMRVMRQVRLRPRGGDDSELLCPRCGGSHLHQGEVVVYSRDEDAAQVRRTVVTPLVTKVTIDPGRGNPSSRRDGLTISFSCEGCGGDGDGRELLLTIAQHKGETEMAWIFDATPPLPSA